MKKPDSLTLDIKTWISLFAPSQRGTVIHDFALGLVKNTAVEEATRVQAFKAFLEEGVFIDAFALARSGASGAFVDALYAHNPHVFGDEEALRGGVEFNCPRTLEYVKAETPQAVLLQRVNKNLRDWANWEKFDGLETAESTLDIPSTHNWLESITDDESCFHVLSSAHIAKNDRWVARVLKHVNYDVERLMPMGSSEPEARAEFERFVLNHKTTEERSQKPTLSGVL